MKPLNNGGITYGDNQKEIFQVHREDLRGYLGDIDFDKLKMEIDQNGDLQCYANLYKNEGGLSKAIIIMDSGLEPSYLKKCASLSLLMNLGFIGNREHFGTLKSASVLSENKNQNVPTIIDQLTLQLLYFTDIKHGMSPHETLKTVRRILKEN